MRARLPLWLIGAGAAVMLVVVLATWSWRNAIATEERLFDYSDALIPPGATVTGEWSYHCVSGDAFSWLNRHRAKTCRALWLDVEGEDPSAALAAVKELSLKEGWTEFVQPRQPTNGAFVMKRPGYTLNVGPNRPEWRDDCTPPPEHGVYCGDIIISISGPKTGLLP